MLRLTGIMGLLASFASAAFARAMQPAIRVGTPKRHGRVYSTRSNRPGKQRLAPAIVGGNWKGMAYLSYAEHDRCTRASMAAGERQYGTAWQAERLRIEQERKRRGEHAHA